MDGRIAPQNLIKEVKAESVVVQPAFYKPLVFDVLTVLSAVVVSYFYKGFLAGGTSWLTMAVVLAVFYAFSSLQIFFTKSFGRRFSILVLEAIALVSFFYDLQPNFLLLAMGIVLVFLLWGEIASRYEYENGVKIKFFRVIKPVFRKITTALILLFLLLYIPHWNSGSIFISQDVFKSVYDPAANFAHTLYPQLDFTSTIDKLATDVTKQELQNDPAYQKLSSAEQDNEVRNSVDQFFKKYNMDNMATPITVGEPTYKVAYDVIFYNLNKWHAQSGDAFIAIWAIVVFFLLRGIAAIFWWIASLIAFLIYEILLAFDFMHIAGENVTHEVIEF